MTNIIKRNEESGGLRSDFTVAGNWKVIDHVRSKSRKVTCFKKLGTPREYGLTSGISGRLTTMSRVVRYRTMSVVPGHGIRGKLASAATSADAGTQTMTLTTIRPDHISRATSTADAIEVEFADNLKRKVAMRLVGLDATSIQHAKTKVADGGSGVKFTDNDGDTFVIDGASLRYLVDKRYAKEVDKQVVAILLPMDELMHQAGERPQR
jgi:hypothetical protein